MDLLTSTSLIEKNYNRDFILNFIELTFFSTILLQHLSRLSYYYWIYWSTLCMFHVACKYLIVLSVKIAFVYNRIFSFTLFTLILLCTITDLCKMLKLRDKEENMK